MNKCDYIAGSRLMIGFNGTRLSDSLKHYIKDLKIGGVILFTRNIENPKQLSDLCVNIQDYAQAQECAPLFIAIDQEGGTVARLPLPFTQFPKGASALKTVQKVVEFAEITALELQTCHINMDMAPVLDIAPPQFGSFMEKRALGTTPESVTELGLAMIKSFRENKIIPVGKHFPGIGRTILDSHVELPVFEDSFESLQDFDLKPFQATIDDGLEAVMLSHILYKELDAENPASLSEKIVKMLLREQMGFEGVVMTDDMDMGAIVENYGYEEAVKKALKSDVDIILVCHESEKIQQTYDLLLQQATGSKADQEAALDAYDRIMCLKHSYLMQEAQPIYRS